MKRDFLAALRAAVAQRAWVMVSILLSLVICASVVVLHLVHERSLDRATDIIRTVRQARLDLYAGFLHASLGGARDSPWQREQGHALLRQAYAQFEASMSGVDGRSAAARELAVRFAEFAALLPPVNQTQTGARQDVDLRVAFHRLDAAAGRLDAEARDALAHSRLEQTRMFWAVLMVAVAVLALLLARTLGLLRLTAEAQGGLRARDAALTESEQRFRQLAENINEVFWLTDTTKSEILYISSGYERIWGRTVATLFEQPRLWLDAIHPEDRQRVEEALPRQALGEYDIEYRILRPDGSLRWIRDRAFPVRDGNGHVYRVAGVAEDISEYRRALSDLTASEARLRVAVEASGIGIFERNMVTELRRYSPEFCAILGVDPVRGWTARKVLEPRVPQAEREALQAAIQAADDPHGTGDFQHEFPVVRADGETRWVVLRGRTHFDDDHGEMRRVRRVGTLVDVTARRQEEARRVLDEKTHALGTLAAGIAHDVNNILLAIDGYTRLAASQIPPDSPASTSVAQIEDAGRRASAIVRRILSFGRQSPLNPEPIRLRPVIEEALELVRPMFAKGVAVSLQVDGEPPWVGVDANQVHQVMVNLLTNAAHALGERGGQIAVRLRAEGANGTGAAVLEVEDDGCGMDETVQKRMFEPFYTTKAERGTGLGLAVVRSVVASCRGSIAVRSAPGAGTRFTLRFPAVPAPSGDAPGVSVLPARDARVLYVDDDADLVFLVTGLLRSRGYRPTGCSSAEEALQRFRADPQSYDAVISDMSMPRMSGLDLAREVLGLRPDLPFVITTGYVRDSDAALARQLGVRAVLVKPDTMDALAAALEREFHSGSAFEPKR